MVADKAVANRECGFVDEVGTELTAVEAFVDVAIFQLVALSCSDGPCGLR